MSQIPKPFASVLEERPTHELMDLRDQLAELKASHAWRELEELMARSRAAVQNAVNHGPERTAAGYAMFASYVSGSEMVEEIIEQVESLAAQRQRELEEEIAAEQQQIRTEQGEAEPAWPEPELTQS